MGKILAYVILIVVVVRIFKKYILPLLPTFTQQLFSYTLDAEMKVLAMDAVTRAKEEYRIQLTYDRSCVADLERKILNDLHNNHLIETLSVEQLASESQLWGAYLGEVLRRIRPGVWREKSKGTERRAMPFTYGVRGEVFPCDWVLRRIKHGEKFNLAAAVEDFVSHRDDPNYRGMDEQQ
jgi:hypothetical protein